MTMWLLFALLARFFWASANASDQILSRLTPGKFVLPSIICLYLACLPVVVLSYCLAGHMDYGMPWFLDTAAAALFAMVAIVPYILALRHEDAQNVTPYMELTPVFLILLAYCFRHETLTWLQGAAAVLIVSAAFLFSWDFAASRFNLRTFLRLSVTSILWAGMQFFWNEALIRSNAWAVCCLFYGLLFVVGVAGFLLLPRTRYAIIETYQKTRGMNIRLAFMTSLLDLAAIASVLFAFQNASSVARVAALSGTQPVFSFLLAIPLGYLLPRHFNKVPINKHTAYKLALILCIGAGVYMLAV